MSFLQSASFALMYSTLFAVLDRGWFVGFGKPLRRTSCNNLIFIVCLSVCVCVDLRWVVCAAIIITVKIN